MNRQILNSLINECELEVLKELKLLKESKKKDKSAEPVSKKETSKKVEKEPVTKGKAVARIKPMDKAFDTLSTGLTRRHSQRKAKEMLHKKIDTINELYMDNIPNSTLSLYRSGAHFILSNSNVKNSSVEISGVDIPGLIKSLQNAYKFYKSSDYTKPSTQVNELLDLLDNPKKPKLLGMLDKKVPTDVLNKLKSLGFTNIGYDEDGNIIANHPTKGRGLKVDSSGKIMSEKKRKY